MEEPRCIKKGKKYYNPHVQKIYRTLWDVILWKLGFFNDPKEKDPPPKDFIYPINLPEYDKQKPTVVWINHCTFLIKVGEISILTDPIWSDCCSPLSFFGPVRRHHPGIAIEDLPKIDYVFISHNHYDHLDKKTALSLMKRFPNLQWFVPLGLKKWFDKKKIPQVQELSWWENISLPNLKITAVPAQHFSGRTGFDISHTLWNGYVLEFEEHAKKLYFSGDTGYNDSDFKEIGKKFEGFDLSMIPIGTYLPRKFMKAVHINPEEAVQIHLDVQSKMTIAMHWKTFHLSDETLDLPPYELYLAMKEKNLDLSKFFAVDPGIFINW